MKWISVFNRLPDSIEMKKYHVKVEEGSASKK